MTTTPSAASVPDSKPHGKPPQAADVQAAWDAIAQSRRQWLAQYKPLLLAFYDAFHEAHLAGTLGDFAPARLSGESGALKEAAEPEELPAIDQTRRPKVQAHIPEVVGELEILAWETFGDADTDATYARIHALTDPLKDTQLYHTFYFDLDNLYGEIMARTAEAAFYNGLRVGQNPLSLVRGK